MRKMFQMKWKFSPFFVRVLIFFSKIFKNHFRTHWLIHPQLTSWKPPTQKTSTPTPPWTASKRRHTKAWKPENETREEAKSSSWKIKPSSKEKLLSTVKIFHCSVQVPVVKVRWARARWGDNRKLRPLFEKFLKEVCLFQKKPRKAQRRTRRSSWWSKTECIWND